MNFSDIIFVFQWWLVFFVIGIIFLPLTVKIFSNFFDKGYIFSKILGIALISYTVFLLGILKIAPFTELTVLLASGIFLVINLFILVKVPPSRRWNLKIFLLEEAFFFIALFFWSYIRSHEPSIHGLEKYMDFGFVNSILRSTYFPPVDIWFPPLPINYYYFGHLVTSVLTRISMIPPFVTYNLMLSTIFAFTFTGAFSIGANLIEQFKVQNSKFKVILGGLLTGFLVSMAGNLHTIYAFFKPYENENPVPFWQLIFSPNAFPNGYWYPNATRFIPNTIHEFPVYSSVVSDLHGHYLDVPFVLLTIALLLSLIFNFQFSIFNQIKNFKNSNSLKISNFKFQILLLAFMLAIMYMTNAWDGIIYFLLTVMIFLYLILNSPLPNFNLREIKNEKLKSKNSLKIDPSADGLKLKIIKWLFYVGIIMLCFFLFSLPFNLHFKPFASGIGVLCAPEFLTNIEKLGPFLFEKDHCQKSPWWQMIMLYGFFYFWAISFVVFLFKKRIVIPNLFRDLGSSKTKMLKQVQHDTNKPDLFILLLILFSTFLILIPEFAYAKDIYPGHYRANTMFKLGYQAFMMLSIASGYIITTIISKIKYQKSKISPYGRSLEGRQMKNKIFNFYYVYLLFCILFFILVMIYPYLAINSYYGSLKTYQGLNGTKYLKNLYPTDYEAILWINDNIKGQPVILEAQGDSYTDYARVSANTGLPTVLGWPVHEWLWRGTYDIPSPRIEEVQKMYESEDLEETKNLLKKHNVEYVFLGDLEHQKYPNLNEEKFKSLGKIIYEKGETKIYDIIDL